MTPERMKMLLEAASASLGVADAPVAAAQIPEWIEARPFAEIQQADTAAREYAATRQWPEMPNDTRAELHLRIEAAAACSQMLALTPGAPMPPDDKTALDILLVDFWRDNGIAWVRYKHWGIRPPRQPLA